MLLINKTNDEPQVLTAFKAKETEEWKPTYEGLHKTERYQLGLHLLKEQGYLCCYCMDEIKMENVTEDNYTKFFHIEHFLPQSSFPKLDITHANIFVSCNSPKHCAKPKGSELIPKYISLTNKKGGRRL